MKKCKISQSLVAEESNLNGGRSVFSNWLNAKEVPYLKAKEEQLRTWLNKRKLLDKKQLSNVLIINKQEKKKKKK